MAVDDMSRGIVPGLIAGYFYIAYAHPEFQVLGVGHGWHMLVSMLAGALYTGVFMLYLDLGNSLMNILVGGVIYGLIWWVIGWNVLMPLLQGDSILQFNLGPSFYGHMIFGHVLAFLVVMRDAAMGMGMGWRSYSGGNLASFPTLPILPFLRMILYLFRMILYLLGRTKEAAQGLRKVHSKWNDVERASRRTAQPDLSRRAKTVKSKMMPLRLEAGKQSHSTARHNRVAEALDEAEVDYALVQRKGRYHLIFLPPDEHRITRCECIVCAAVNDQGLKLTPYRGRPPTFCSNIVRRINGNCGDRWKIDRDGYYHLPR